MRFLGAETGNVKPRFPNSTPAREVYYTVHSSPRDYRAVVLEGQQSDYVISMLRDLQISKTSQINNDLSDSGFITGGKGLEELTGQVYFEFKLNTWASPGHFWFLRVMCSDGADLVRMRKYLEPPGVFDKFSLGKTES